MKNTWLLIIKCIITIIAAIYIIEKLNISKIIGLWQYFDWTYLFGALILQNISLLISSARSRLYLFYHDIRINYLQSINLYYIGTLYNHFLPGGVSGDGYKIYLLRKKHGLKVLSGIKVFLYERINGVAALIILGCCIGLVSSFMLTTMIFYITLGLSILGLPIYLMIAHYILKDQVAKQAFIYSLCVQLMQICFIYMVIKGVNTDQTINYILLFCIASIVTILPLTIGGIGLRELTFIYGSTLIPTLDMERGIMIATISFLIYVLSSILGVLIMLIKNDLYKLK